MNIRLGSPYMYGLLHRQFSGLQTLKITFIDSLCLSTWFLSVISVVDLDLCSTFSKRRDGEYFLGPAETALNLTILKVRGRAQSGLCCM